jgi:predicted phage-related endonuclease
MNAAVDQRIAADLAFREQRRKYLGGSDIGALLGIAPKTWRRNTPLALYLDKVEPPTVDTQNVGVKRRGKRWEAVVGEMLVEALETNGHTVEILKTNERYVDPDFAHFACEIDWEIRLDGETDITNVELKTVHPYKVAEWGEEGTDASPVWYTAQAMWGLGITRRRRCIIAPLFGADEIRIYPVGAADDVIGEIRSTADKFWTENVLARVPPLPGGLVDLARLFPNDCGKEIELGDNLEFVDAIVELRAADEDFDNAKVRWEHAEEIAKRLMEDAAVATIGGNKACSWKTQADNRLDVTAIKEKRPDIYKEFVRSKDIRKFLLTRPKAKK